MSNSGEVSVTHNNRPPQRVSAPPWIRLCPTTHKRKLIYIILCTVIAILIVLAIIISTIIVSKRQEKLITRSTTATITTPTTATTTITTATTTSPCPQFFHTPVTYKTDPSFELYSVTTADVNGDNKPDLITTNPTASNIAVFLNTGTGIFNVHAVYFTGTDSEPIALTTADVNGDNKPDIIVAHRNANNVCVFINTGTGSFYAQATYSTGSDSRPVSLTTADVNGDNKPDIIVANLHANNVGVFINTGNGTFHAQATYFTGTNSVPISVTTADVNGDNKTDILVANFAHDNIGIFLNTGTGAFHAQVTYSTSALSHPVSVTATDINGDNNTDIIVANFAQDNIGVFLSNPTGTHNTQATYSTGFNSAPYSVTTADFDGDNKTDIIFATNNANNIGVMLNTGNGTFHAHATYWAGSGNMLLPLTTADVNGDNKPDIIGKYQNPSFVSVLLNSGRGWFNIEYSVLPDPYFERRSVTTTDVNGDNKLDIIIANSDRNHNGNNIAIFLNTDTGMFYGQAAYFTGYDSKPSDVITADVNGDNTPDIIVANSGGNNVGVFLNAGNGTFHAQATYFTGTNSQPTALTTADVNGDNKTDIIVANIDGNNIGVFLNTGTGTFHAQVTYSTSALLHPISVTATDINGDNKPDIIVASHFVDQIGVFINTVTGTFYAQATYSTGSNSQPKALTTADVNEDNKTDIIVANYAGNNVGVFLNTGTGMFHAQLTYSTDPISEPLTVTTADVNGDNKPDIIVGNESAKKVVVYLNTGAGTFYKQVTYSIVFGRQSDLDDVSGSATTADVNGDNKPDMIVANSLDNSVAVFLNTGTGTFYGQATYSTASGFGAYSVTTADVNGDNKADIIVANYDADNFGVFINTGTGSFYAQATYSTGSNSRPLSLTTADVNGDNKPDIIVANLHANNVGVFLNTGNGTFHDQATYSSGSFSFWYSVTAADVNGDNKPDIIVTNREENNVGVFLNTGNGTFYAKAIYSTGSNWLPQSVTTADVNGDGKPDIIVVSGFDQSVAVFLNTGTGTFYGHVKYSTDSASTPYCVTTGDVNGDNKPDIIVANWGGMNVGVFVNTGTGAFYAQATYSIGSQFSPQSVTIADVNGDNKLDIIVASHDRIGWFSKKDWKGNIGVIWNMGNGTFYAVASYPTGSDWRPHSVTTADVNGDNKPDIIVVGLGYDYIAVLLNTGLGTFYEKMSYSIVSNEYVLGE